MRQGWKDELASQTEYSKISSHKKKQSLNSSINLISELTIKKRPIQAVNTQG